jgi:Cellulase (glycosyl hydrolase family 5)
MKTISRRDFIERSVKLACLAGFGGRRPGGTVRIGPAEHNPAGSEPSARPSIDIDKDPSLKPAADRFFGVQTHFGQFRPAADDLLNLVQGAGIGWIRDEVYWSEVEKEKGLFTFPPAYDHYLKAARGRGIEVLLILDFSNPLYTGSDKRAPANDAERQAFARYCREVVKRCAPFGVRHYEIWNEPNASTFWRPQPNPEDYARLLESAFRACKEADPKATVLGCSTAGVDLDYIGRVIRAGGASFMDGVSFHPYCQPSPPERKLLTDISKVQKAAPDKPLWITEFGYPTHAGPAGVDEEAQANYLVRAFLLARSFPAVKRFCWYDFQNDGEDPAEGEFNFGLVRMDKTPKPAYRAYKTMTSLVGDLAPAELRVEGGTYIARFGEGERPLLAVWRLGGAESTQIPYPDGPCRIIERDGESRAVEVKESTLEIEVSEKPRYIVRAA